MNKNQNYKTFLDVGCNIGTAVEAARLEGMEGCGVEIDYESIQMAKSYFPENEFEVISVQDFSKTGRKFDVIYSTEVVEHLNDPHGFFEAVSELLSPQGVFYLTTPDGGHFMTPKKEKIMQWPEMKLPEHISIFTKKSLLHLLNKHGFNKHRFVLNMKSGIKCISRKTA